MGCKRSSYVATIDHHPGIYKSALIINLWNNTLSGVWQQKYMQAEWTQRKVLAIGNLHKGEYASIDKD